MVRGDVYLVPVRVMRVKDKVQRKKTFEMRFKERKCLQRDWKRGLNKMFWEWEISKLGFVNERILEWGLGMEAWWNFVEFQVKFFFLEKE